MSYESPSRDDASRAEGADLGHRLLGSSTGGVAWYGGLVAVYLVSRGALLGRFPPHVDESLFAQWTLRGYESAEQRFAPLAAGQHPLLEWLGMAIMPLGVEPLTAVRLVSLLSGVLILGLVAHLGAYVGGTWVGRLAALLWVVLPFGLVYSVIGLYDPLAAALVCAAATLQLHLARRPSLGLALLLGLVLGAGLLTKLTTLVAFWLVPLGALVFDWSRDALGRRLARWLGALAVAGALAFVLYQILQLSELADDLPVARDTVLARHSVGEFLGEPRRWIEHNWPEYRAALLGYLTVPGVVAAVAGAVLIVRRRPRVGLYLVGWAVLPLAAVVALADLPFVRWLLVSVPFVVVLAAVGLVELLAFARRLAATRVQGRPRGAVVLAVCTVAVVLVPAVAWDGRTLLHPVTREYPGRDDLDYARAYSAGGPWLELVPDLRERRGGGPLVVATSGAGLYYVETAVRDDGIELVDSADERAAVALLGVENGSALQGGPAPLAWRRIATYERPRDGVPVTLYERGVSDGAGFSASPDELRRVVGGSDADFDSYVASHPSVQSWLEAWYRAASS